MRWIIGGHAVTKRAASTSQMRRSETEVLATDANVGALADMNGMWIDKVHDRGPPNMIILDMDISVSPTHGDQEGTAYNGHFGCACHHPLFLFNRFGDLERCSLRSGNVHSANDWEGVLKPVVVRYKDRKVQLYVINYNPILTKSGSDPYIHSIGKALRSWHTRHLEDRTARGSPFHSSRRCSRPTTRPGSGLRPAFGRKPGIARIAVARGRMKATAATACPIGAPIAGSISA